MVGSSRVVDDVDLLDAKQQRGVDELKGRAAQAVDPLRIGVDALGVRHADDRDGELPGIDAERLALEPLDSGAATSRAPLSSASRQTLSDETGGDTVCLVRQCLFGQGGGGCASGPLRSASSTLRRRSLRPRSSPRPRTRSSWRTRRTTAAPSSTPSRTR